jgi:hypothetical protein
VVWIYSCEKAIQLAYGMPSVLFHWPFLPEIMHEGAPEAFLYGAPKAFLSRKSWKVAIWPLLCWFNVKPTKKKDI